MADALGPAEHLRPAHDITTFDSGVPELDDWLKKPALPNEVTRASRTYVVCADGRVVGYYALATGSVADPPGPPNTLRPMPVMILGRLAVGGA